MKQATEELNIWFNEQLETINVTELSNANKSIEIHEADNRIWIPLYQRIIINI